MTDRLLQDETQTHDSKGLSRMTDHKLIEEAARAVDLPECGWMADTFTYVKDNTFTTWDPLNDDGDALGIAVKLRLSICHHHADDNPAVTVMAGIEWHRRFGEWHEAHANDPAAATRRAIVRAAAALHDGGNPR